MAVIELNQTTFVEVDQATEPVLVQFAGTGAVQVAQSASPAAGDWLTMATNEVLEFPAGAPIFARAPNGAAVRAITRPFEDGAGGTPLPRVALSVDPVVGLKDDAPVGATVATITTDATALTLGGADAAKAQISGANIVTTETLEGLTGLSFTVLGVKDGYSSRTVSVAVAVEAAEEPDPVLAATITPNPIVMDEPFTAEFIVAPDEVTGSVTLTGSGTTYTGVGPASSPVSLGATKAGYTAYSATITVDTAVITPTAPITAAAMYETQTAGDIPGFATKSSTSGYTRAGRTITSVQVMAGRYADADPDEPDAPVGITDLEPATAATVLDEGRVVIARVTDSGGTVRDFTLAETEYAVRIALNTDGTYDVDINPLVPAGLEIPITDGGATSSISRNDLADGEEIHVLPTLTGTAAVGATLTGTEGVWFITGTTATITRSITADGATVHTFDEDDPLEYVVQAGDAGKALRLVEALDGSTAQSGAVNIPAPAGSTTPPQFLAQYSQSGASPTASYSDVDLGAPDASRDILVIAGHAGGVHTATAVVIGGVSATRIDQRVSADGNAHLSLWKARVPTGATGSVTVTYSGGVFARHLAVWRGVNVGTITTAGSGVYAPTISASLASAPAGAKAFGSVILDGAAGAPTFAWTGATEVYEANINAPSNPYKIASMAEGVVGGDGAAHMSVTIGSANRQQALLIFAAGAA